MALWVLRRPDEEEKEILAQDARLITAAAGTDNDDEKCSLLRARLLSTRRIRSTQSLTCFCIIKVCSKSLEEEKEVFYL